MEKDKIDWIHKTALEEGLDISREEVASVLNGNHELEEWIIDYVRDIEYEWNID